MGGAIRAPSPSMVLRALQRGQSSAGHRRLPWCSAGSLSGVDAGAGRGRFSSRCTLEISRASCRCIPRVIGAPGGSETPLFENLGTRSYHGRSAGSRLAFSARACHVYPRGQSRPVPNAPRAACGARQPAIWRRRLNHEACRGGARSPAIRTFVRTLCRRSAKSGVEKNRFTSGQRQTGLGWTRQPTSGDVELTGSCRRT